MDFSNIACWIWPLIAGIVCGILGYLLGRLFGKGDDLEDHLELWKRKNAQLQADLNACNAKRKETQTVESMAASYTAKTATVSTQKGVSFDATAAKAAFGKRIKEDDLTVVAGIGPKISELFHKHEITTWAQLASTSIEKCQEVLNSGGKRFDIHSPEYWPKQASWASEGAWSQLKKWQEEHEYRKG